MSILVFAENRDGLFKKPTFELLSYATEMAKSLNTNVIAISIGNVEGSEFVKLGAYGANKVLNAVPAVNLLDNKTWANIIASAAEKEKAVVVLFPGSITGMSLAPAVAARLKAGLVTGAVALPSAYDPMVVQKKVFTGKAYAMVKVITPIKVLTLAQNSFGVHEPGTGTPMIEDFAVAGASSSVRLLEVKKQTGKILLTDAEIVVSGGRGMKAPENFALLEELAGLLGAATACSRPVSDEGWRPHSEHVGQTGKIIAPVLYIACGISGAIQHVGGVSSSNHIVAINNDKDAPIFDVADYGVVGDFKTVLPEMIAAIKDAKSR
ncbi:MAG: electron transfer flavoprotein subunit alpha/FixB family protein [Bacteroidales bacterium]